jgi:hypothetical protein
MKSIFKKFAATILFVSASAAYAEPTVLFPQAIQTAIPNTFPGTDYGASWKDCDYNYGCAQHIGNNEFVPPTTARYPNVKASVSRFFDFIIGGREPGKTYTLTFFHQYDLTTMTYWNNPASDSGFVYLSLTCNPTVPKAPGTRLQTPNGNWGVSELTNGTGVALNGRTLIGTWIITPDICPENLFRVETSLAGSRIKFNGFYYTNVFE